MLRCNEHQCEMVNGPQLARLTQKQLGFVDPATAAQMLTQGKSMFEKIAGFFQGLIGKNPDKTQFDYVRQNTWNHYAQIFDAVEGLRRTNQLTQEILESYTQSLQKLVDEYDAYYGRVRDAVGAAWGDPRFHDYYDPFVSTLQAWQAELQQGTLPREGSGGVLDWLTGGGSTGSHAGPSGASLLLMGGVLLALLSNRSR